ncbi:MAG TPA: cation diffusion facilitator family transporter [Candidatus Binatia bacterium]|nr:cation diffusion facilitator family transporter [Candidatus Binatia bacterium]
MSASHAHAHTHASSSTLRLKIALALTAAVAIFEFAGGWIAHSLALISDSVHVVTDVVALAIALAATIQATRPANARQTYGFARMEILAALANGTLLFGITLLIGFEAIRRLMQPEPTEGGLMAVVAAIGFVVNVSVGVMLARGSHDNLNLRAALLHVAGDALGAIAVAIGGIVILATGLPWIDPALSLFVGLIIVLGVWRVVREASDVLLESAPSHATVPLVRDRIRSLDGVVDVHDLHVWSIGSGRHVLSAHVLLTDKRISEASAILRRIEDSMRDDFEITHVTVQFECESCEADDRIVCTQSD